MNYIKTFEKYIDHNKLWWDLGLTTKSSSDDELELPLDDEDTNDKDKKDDSNEEDLPELSPELFENFKQEEITEFMSVIKDKVLELSDIGFNVKVEDKNSEPLLENMIRIHTWTSGNTCPRPFEWVHLLRGKRSRGSRFYELQYSLNM